MVGKDLLCIKLCIDISIKRSLKIPKGNQNL